MLFIIIHHATIMHCIMTNKLILNLVIESQICQIMIIFTNSELYKKILFSISNIQYMSLLSETLCLLESQ